MVGEIKYSEDHEWIMVEDGIATIGITRFAKEQLGDIVFVELPEIGREVEVGGEAGVVESVKAASEVYAPVSGEITEINETLETTPDLVNEDPEGDAWFFKVKISDSSELNQLMDETAYKAFCNNNG